MNKEMQFFAFNNCASSFKILGLDMDLTEYSAYFEENCLSHDQTQAIDDFLQYLRNKKIQSTIDMYLRTSRLPLKFPKTFSNFDFSAIKGKHADRLKALSDLNAIQAHKILRLLVLREPERHILLKLMDMNAVKMVSRPILLRCRNFVTNSP